GDRPSPPISASHPLTVLSSLPETMRLPFGLKATLLTPPACPLRVRFSRPVSASQTFTVQSSPPLTMRLPSALNATLQSRFPSPSAIHTSPRSSAYHT